MAAGLRGHRKPGVPQGLPRSAARRLPARHAHLQGPESGQLVDHRRRRHPRCRTDALAHRLAAIVEGDLEGDRQRPADQHRRSRCAVRSTSRPEVDGGGGTRGSGRAPWPGDRLLEGVFADQERHRQGVPHRRRPLHRGHLLRARPRHLPRLLPVLGVRQRTLHAGAFPVSPLDATFGPRYEYVHAPQKANTSPAEGFQHFGEVRIAKDTKVLTVALCDSHGQVLYTKELTP